MENINWIVHHVVTIAFTSVAVAVAVYLLKPDPEAAIDYEVPLPEQCEPEWKGEVLENPSIKVRLYKNDFLNYLRACVEWDYIRLNEQKTVRE